MLEPFKDQTDKLAAADHFFLVVRVHHIFRNKTERSEFLACCRRLYCHVDAAPRCRP